MAFTANKNLEQPARGSNVGVWDTPVNSNTGIIDNSFGGVATIALTNSNVTLSAGQYQNVFLVLTGAISANIAITLPAVGSFYSVQNLTSNTSAFYITMTTTAASGQVIGIPPGEVIDIMTDATNVKFRNIGRVGTFVDFGGSSVPAWVTACTVPPYLNCDGTSFSSATYPILATVLGGTTLPDSRGRSRYALNQGQGRITSTGAGTGLDGNTNLSGGGSQTFLQANLPDVTWTTSQTPHSHYMASYTAALGGGAGYGGGWVGVDGQVSSPELANITVTSGGSGTNYVPPAYVGGITMIRAA